MEEGVDAFSSQDAKAMTRQPFRKEYKMVTKPRFKQEQTEQFPLWLQNRIFPHSFRTLAIPDSELSAPPPPRQVKVVFRDSIRNRLSFPLRSESDFQNSSSIVRAFGRDMMLLESMATQWRAFLMTLKSAQLDVHREGGVPAKVRRKAIDAIFKKMGYKPQQMVDDGQVLSTTLLTEPQQVVFRQLQAALLAAIDHFVQVLQNDLEQLADVRVVGLIDWTSESVCRFHFFEHELRLTTDHDKERVLKSKMKLQGTRWVVDKKVLKELAGRKIHRVKRIEEQLMGATSSRPERVKIPIPKRVTALIEAIPEWLKPELRIVEGEKFREECVTLTRVESKWEVTETEQRIEPHFDPALTLFNEFVLAGWDDRQHEREIKRRISATNRHFKKVRENDQTQLELQTRNWVGLLNSLSYGLLAIMLIVLGFSMANWLGLLALLASGLALQPVKTMLSEEFADFPTEQQFLTPAFYASWLLGLWAAAFLVLSVVHADPGYTGFGMSFLLISAGLLGLVWILITHGSFLQEVDQ